MKKNFGKWLWILLFAFVGVETSWAIVSVPGEVPVSDSVATSVKTNIVVSKPLPAWAVLTEIIGLNVFVWGWDYYVLDKNYAHTGPDYWLRNLEEGWSWDHNHWAINFFGHPYQGSMYYMAAREAGYGFYRSMAFAMFGSFTWEMFAETEYPAPNDFVTTSIAGSMYGEALFRLSRLIYGPGEHKNQWFRQLAALGLEPTGYLNRKAFGLREHGVGDMPLFTNFFVGGGSRFGSSYRYGGMNVKKFDGEWRDFDGFLGLDLEYGLPYRRVNRPMDYFLLNAYYTQGFEGSEFRMDLAGKLGNKTVSGNSHWLDFGTYLDYDTFYGDFATIGTVSLGGGVDLGVRLNSGRLFRITNLFYWIMLGTADMGYDDIIREVHPEYSSNMNNYQYNTGFRYILNMEFYLGQRLHVVNKLNVDMLHTIPGSLPHYGAEGWDVIVFDMLQAEYEIRKWLGLGARFDTYFKFAAYETDLFDPMYRRTYAFNLYLSFKLQRE